MAGPAGERVHAATPRRLQQARQTGHVPLSRDLASSLVMLALVTSLMLWGEQIGKGLLQLASQQLSGNQNGHVNASFSVETVTELWFRQLAGIAQLMLPLLGVVVLVAIASHASQTGFLFLPDRVMPRLENIQPQRGLQQIFSIGNLAQWLMTILRLLVVLSVASLSLWYARDELAELALVSPLEMAGGMSGFLFQTAARICLGLLVLGIGDYFWQRWRWQEQLRMTSEELREEQRLHG